MNELTTPFKDTTVNPPTTQEQTRETLVKEDEPMIPTEPTTAGTPGMDDEIPNDITLGDPQGRSIKGSSGKNIVPLDDKDSKHHSSQVEVVASPSLQLLPSTVYKTFTYLTTFYIPDENDVTTTSVKSREVVSSEVSYVTEFIAPSASIASETTTTETPITPPEPEQRETTTSSTTTTTTTVKTKTTENTSPPTTPKIETSSESTSESEEEQTTEQDEEIELIFKTLYTTYTYLTTFFQEQTSSVISHEVVETNIITQTVGLNYDISADVASLFDKTESVLIAPTRSQEITPPSVTIQPVVETEAEESTEEEDHVATTEESRISTIDVEQETEITTESSLEPTPSAEVTPQIHQDVVKTYYTTYTYFTTIFVEDETEIETRTEVFTNVVTSSIQPSTVLPTTPKSELPDTLPTPETPTTEKMPKPQEIEKPAVPPEILAYLEAIQKQKSQEEALELAKKVKEETNGDETMVTGESQETTESPPPTSLQADSDNVSGVAVVEEPEMTPNPLDEPGDGEVLGRMVTDVVSTSSSGGGTILDAGERRINTFPDDQEISESNNHEVEPAVTLLLQTSYTTFTYFTTMYKGDASNVVSRLETITNTVTETIRPSAIDSQPVISTITAPSTEFTTLTYWTTFYKDGDTITNSREETISNVATPEINPSPTTEVAPLPSRDYVVGANVQPEGNVLDNEVRSPSLPVSSEAPSTTEDAVTQPGDQAADVSNVGNRIAVNNNESISPDPTTFYTTFTYFTTSYVGNSTVLNSRLETVTSIAQPADRATGRAIGGGATAVPSVQALDTIDKPSPARATGIISTVRSSKVVDGTTTHFATDVRGTFINGLYAQVIESSTRIEKPEDSTASTAKATPVLPTGVLSLNRGSIIDADEISTVYFTTRQLGTVVDGLYAKVVESTSSTKIDEERRATVTPSQTGTHRTGLVRLIEGYVEANDTTIFYRSKVIGTSIDGRYAQIIESTSSWLSATPAVTASGELASSIAPSAADGNIAMSSAAFPTQVHPSPAVVESSMSDDPTTESSTEDSTEEIEDDTEDEDDDRNENVDGQKTSKRSRLTFTTKSKSFTPVIRPFAPRSRPTFNPKRKGAQGATTITRTDITPTITATLAGKGNRFASSRNRISSPTGPYSSTLGQTGQFSGSRRGFSGRRSSSTSIFPSGSGFASGSTRGRGSSRISPTSVFRGRGSGPSSIGSGRGSSRNGPRFSSSLIGGPAGSSRYRPGIRASSTLLRGQQPSVRNEDQDDNANDYTATTIVTEETPYTEDDRYYEDDGETGETGTVPFQTTTESIRRTTNPLLKFRRPLTLGNSPVSGRLGNTQRPPTTTTRRNGNLVRPTGSTPNRLPFLAGRTGNRPSLPTYTRPRQTQQNLFPPRGLYNRRPEPTESTETTDLTETPPPIDEGDEIQEDDEIFEDDEPIDEIVDNDYEASEQDLTSENRRSGKTAYTPNSGAVRIRPFVGRAGRVRRQASQLRALTTNRFRRPPAGQSNSPQAKTEEKPQENPEPEDSTESSQKSKPASTSRFGSYRGRSQSSRRTNGNTSSNKNKNDNNKPTEDATEATPSGKPRSRSKARPSGSRSSPSSSRIKPSPTSSSSRQFTLREKDSSSSTRSGYKRPGSSSSRSRTTGKTESFSRPRPPRIRGGGSRSSHTEAPVSSKRTSSDGRHKTGSRPSGSRNSNGRRTSSSRNRGANSQPRDEPRELSFEPDFDGTITVTHYIPAQATIPAVTNGVTELKYVVTARPSTQVLGPDRYSTVVGVDGQPLTVISGDVTGTNAQGQTEVTRFLLHESTTTSITRGPTSIGGRRTTFSRVIPSTVYSVENVVSTQQPSLPAANAPLANILLSQLLLGQLGQGNPLLGGLQQPQQPQQQGTPTTRYDTRTTSYVTTITKHQSTVIPLTFRGKEILTTLVDSSVDVITATEFITDTVVITPTAALPTPDINSLLLLLQQPTQPQLQPQLPFQQPNPFDPLFAVTPASTQGNELPGEVERRRQPADVDYKPSRESEDDEEEVFSALRDEDEDEQREPERRHRPRTRKNGFGKPASSGKKEEPVVEESSVVTLYVSGKRPGEFSTVLSTVRVGEDASVSRSRRDIGNPPPVIELHASRGPSLHAAPETIMVLDGGEELVGVHSPTQSLESVVGDVGRHISATMIYA
ncbi:mucin-5AC-like [Diprion similis]|uniref:mucin-5AC-like n=1 Tax=Diprion similis TaxID=362088 RepID=UPI001EF974D5|nr:mucin-5AC-like [Diprion similis]